LENLQKSNDVIFKVPSRRNPSMFISQKRQIRHTQHTLVQSKSEWCHKT